MSESYQEKGTEKGQGFNYEDGDQRLVPKPYTEEDFQNLNRAYEEALAEQAHENGTSTY